MITGENHKDDWYCVCKLFHKIKHASRLSDEIIIISGVEQGYVLSPTLFLIFMAWVMKNKKTGINWRIFIKFGNLKFSHDKKIRMQRKTTKLKQIAEQERLIINEKIEIWIDNGQHKARKISIGTTSIKAYEE